MQLNDYPKELGEYWGILSRRKIQFLVPLFLVLGGAVALAFLLPPTYRSEATILINRQTIPENLVATTVTGYAQEQIQQTLQRITTNDNLLSIAREYDLYPDDIDVNRQRVVAQVRDSIEVEMLDVQASNPGQPGTRVATIAFTVGFKAADPATAQAVAADLSDRFLEVRRQFRASTASEVSQFLAAEAESITAEIEQYEQQLAGFKQGEMRQLPELMGMNLQMYERTEQDIDATEQRIRGLQERIDATRAEMSLTPAYEEVLDEEGRRILSASQRLSVLTAEYLQASSRYSAEHPDIMA
jgi:polysaccharide biosynthesis transport protein